MTLDRHRACSSQRPFSYSLGGGLPLRITRCHFDFYYKCGVRQFLCTDISRDGMLNGPSVDLYKEIMKRFPDCYLIASGGVSGKQDLIDLEEAKIPAVVLGKAIYEGRITLNEIMEMSC